LKEKIAIREIHLTYQDVISIQPSIFKHITVDTNDPTLRDDNVVFLRTILRQKGPMTVRDIVNQYKENDNQKSDKTIYRYLGKLTEAGIVAKVGKRVFIDEENNIRTETLYGNSAFLFLTAADIHPFSENAEGAVLLKRDPITRVIGLFLKKKLGARKVNEECLKEILVKRHTNAQEYLIKTVELGDEEIYNLVKELEYYDTGVVLEVVAWLGSIMSEPNIVKDIEKCFK
jgi:predicted transcriptional regulator